LESIAFPEQEKDKLKKEPSCQLETDFIIGQKRKRTEQYGLKVIFCRGHQKIFGMVGTAVYVVFRRNGFLTIG
jgi:hypothetical protein